MLICRLLTIPPVMGGFYCKISSMAEWWSPKPQTGVRYPYLAFAKEKPPQPLMNLSVCTREKWTWWVAGAFTL